MDKQDMQYTTTSDLEFIYEWPGVCKICDPDRAGEIVGYLKHEKDEFTFYPKARHAYSFPALQAIYDELDRHVKQAKEQAIREQQERNQENNGK